MRVNRLKDFLERVGWTFLQAELALGLIDWLSKGINLSLLHTIYASLGAAVASTIKVLLAQQFGVHKDGAAIPGGVIEPAP